MSLQHFIMYTRKLILCFAICNMYINRGDAADDPWTMLPNMDNFCPGADVCRRNASSLKQEIVYEDGFGACCRECSCEDECGLNGNCCFPQLDKYNITPRDQQQCVLPSTSIHQPQKLLHAYYMVTDNPPTGCHSDMFDFTAETNESATCGEQTIAPWGNLLPVYSSSTGLLYKNERCAVCHGVSEWIRWDAILVCERFDSSDTNHAWSIPEHIGYLELNHEASVSHCHVQFQYPGAIADIIGAQCFDHATDVCSEFIGFDIYDFNITDSDIVKGCNSGLFSPFPSLRGWFKNVFCFMCSQKHFETSQLQKCAILGNQSSRGNSFDYFVTLLDSRYIDSLQKIGQDTDNRPKACVKDQTLPNRSNCRMLHCPAGRLFFPDGNCRFPSQRWYGETLSIFIKLTPDNLISLSAFKAIYTEILDRNLKKKTIEKKLKSKIQQNWRIYEMYQENYSTSSGESMLKNLYIRLLYKFPNKSPEEITKHARIGLEEVWTLTLNGSRFKLVPEIAEFSTLRGKSKSFKPLWHDYINNHSDFHTHISAPNLWKVFNINDFLSYTFITKMFFCKQIQLEPGEFVFDETKTLLYVNATGKFLFESEFGILRDVTGIYVPRICLRDSIFEEINGTGKGTTSVGYLPVIVLCLMLVWL